MNIADVWQMRAMLIKERQLLRAKLKQAELKQVLRTTAFSTTVRLPSSRKKQDFKKPETDTMCLSLDSV